MNNYSQGGMHAQPQGFSGAMPRVMLQKQQPYRDPYGQNNTDGKSAEYFPANIHNDKRVFRGSTNAAMVIPAGSYPDQLFRATASRGASRGVNSRGSTRGSTRPGAMTQQQRAQRAEEFFTRDINTPEPLAGRQNIDIQTDQFVTELTDKAPCYAIGIQTDFNIQQVEPNWRMCQVVGKSKKTLVEDNELFMFNDEVAPILSVLCGRVLEEAAMEVLEEEELTTMNHAQDQYKKLMELEQKDVKESEDQENQKLERHEKNKKERRLKKDALIKAHQLVASRITTKGYLASLKSCVFQTCLDTSLFVDGRTKALQTRIMPWMLDQAEQFVDAEEQLESMPGHLLTGDVSDVAGYHQTQIDQHVLMIKNRREAEQKEAEDKVQAKIQRGIERNYRRKMKRFQALKDWIEENSIKKGQVVEGILTNSAQDILDVDSAGITDTQQIQVLGGYLGQLIIVVNSIAKYIEAKERPSSQGSKKSRALKSPVSGRSRNTASKKVTSNATQNNDDVASGAGGQSGIDEQEEEEVGHPALRPKTIQHFIHTYIAEKMKGEKFPVQVPALYKQFLENLPVPLALGEMRTMKTEKLTELRQMLSRNVGGSGLQWMRNHQEHLGLQEGIFSLVFESFWDLYTFKPALHVYPKALQQWIKRIKLVPQPDEPVEEPAPGEGEDEEEKKTQGDVTKRTGGSTKRSGDNTERNYETIDQPEDEKLPAEVQYDALIRIRVAKKRPEEEPEEGSDGEKKSIHESELEEMPIEDKCLAIQSMWAERAGEAAPAKVAVINQAVARTVRQDLLTELLNSHEAYDKVDFNEVLNMIETDAEEMEKKLIGLFSEGEPLGEVPQFDFKPQVGAQ